MVFLVPASLVQLLIQLDLVRIVVQTIICEVFLALFLPVLSKFTMYLEEIET